MDRRYAIVGGIVTAVVVLVAIIVTVASLGGNSCELVEKKPTIDASKPPPNLVSHDYSTIANFAGYLIYQPDPKAENWNRIFLPLELKTLKRIDHHTAKQVGWLDNTTLTLVADCATITMHAVPNSNALYIVSMLIDLVVPDGRKRSCYIDTSVMIYQPDQPNRHYVCRTAKNYYCFRAPYQSELVATLAVTDFELQLFGDKEWTRKGEFSTALEYCR